MMDLLIVVMIMAFGGSVLAATALAMHRVRRWTGIGRPLWWNLSALLVAAAATIWYLTLDLGGSLRQAFPPGGYMIDVRLQAHAGAPQAQAVLDDLTPLMLASATPSAPAHYRIHGNRVQVSLGGRTGSDAGRLQPLFNALLRQDLWLPAPLDVELETESGKRIPARLDTGRLGLGITRIPAPEFSSGSYRRMREVCVLDGILELSPDAAAHVLDLSIRSRLFDTHALLREPAQRLHITGPAPGLGLQTEYELVHWREHSLTRATAFARQNSYIPARLNLSESRYAVSGSPCDDGAFRDIDPLWLHLAAKRDYPAVARHAAAVTVAPRRFSRWYSRKGWVRSPTLKLQDGDRTHGH